MKQTIGRASKHRNFSSKYSIFLLGPTVQDRTTMAELSGNLIYCNSYISTHYQNRNHLKTCSQKDSEFPAGKNFEYIALNWSGPSLPDGQSRLKVENQSNTSWEEYWVFSVKKETSSWDNLDLDVRDPISGKSICRFSM